jgi:hypothetical protein
MKGPLEYSSSINGSWSGFNADPDPKYIPQLIEAELVGSDPYGALSSGSLTVRGKVVEAFTVCMGPDDDYRLFGVDAGPDSVEIGCLWRDIKLCEECNPVGTVETFSLLCCMDSKTKEEGQIMTTALALKPDDVETVVGSNSTHALQSSAKCVFQRFQRVGLAVYIAPSVWDTASDLTLTLV